jgi:hypothetical protein
MTLLRYILASITLMVTAFSATAQQHVPSKVDLAFNRFYDYEQMTQALQQLVQAYPDLLTLQSLGQSEEGRQIWLVTLNDPATGTDTVKPAMWIDGNVHGNEIQAAEVVLYSIWYLTKSYGQVEPLTELMQRCAFYFVPMVNPDGRANWFQNPTTPHAQRSGQRPIDNDYDGRLDEDGPEDLDGDGHIGTMWRLDPNGTHRRNASDPRIIERVPRDEKGDLRWAGSEGIDNDGDGRINEDGPGGYDMNRNWPSDWQPNYIQSGAGDHPFSSPETRALGQFISTHPNIAAGQSYHNSGGMMLRGPGTASREGLYNRRDLAVYDALGQAGEEMLPFYDYQIIHADLYTVHGGFVNWLAEGLGIVSFTNELWTTERILQDENKPFDKEAQMRWQDRLLFGQTFTDWTEHDHPTLGTVLIGGGTKHASRTPPPFMLEEGCHRNFAFTMFHAANMPNLTVRYVQVEPLGQDLYQITVEIENDKLIPTRLAVAANRKIGTPDRLTLSGQDVTVAAAGSVDDRFDKTIDPVAHRQDRLLVERGIGSQRHQAFRFIVQGAAGTQITLGYEAQKARDLQITFPLTQGIYGAEAQETDPS